MSKSRQPKKARCKQCGSAMLNKTAFGTKLTSDGSICVKCEADNIIERTIASVRKT